MFSSFRNLESRKVHVEVVQWRQINVPKSMMHVQCCTQYGYFYTVCDHIATQPSHHQRNRHQEVYSPPHNNFATIDTVYLPGIVTSSSSPNKSLSILIDTLRRTSHLQFYYLLDCGVSPFLAWGDFHARSRFARSTVPQEKWETTRSLLLVNNCNFLIL